MPRRDLTDRFCAAAKPAEGDRQTDYFDKRKGLALRVSDTAKGWTYLFTWGGKRVRMSLGTYPATSLARARVSRQDDLERQSLLYRRGSV